MKYTLRLLCGAPVLFIFCISLAGPREYLFEYKRLCDASQVFCFRGSMTYSSNPRVLHLRARVQKAPGPGMLRISLSGSNNLGHRHFAPFEVQVHVSNSEIINHKMIPDYPDVESWTVERIEFVEQSELGAK